MAVIQNAKIHITGIVQGVGFRPFIFALATRFGLNGWVRNSSSGVDIDVDGSDAILQEFILSIRSELPPLARIDTLTIARGLPENYSSFEIIQSTIQENAFQPISPDLAVCEECLSELYDPNDRRYNYPFINCTNCGPRYTIITDIPYDRPNTTMAPFVMCPECEREYKDPGNRRFHAQPVACSICGPKVWLEWAGDPDQLKIYGNQVISTARLVIAEGKILAIKGLGGFHLACDATNAIAVEKLRNKKLRVDKPFALMMADIPTIQEHCFVSDEEVAQIHSRQRPIVILKKRPDAAISPQVSPNQDTFGVMLPYTPLHYLLFDRKEKSLQVLVMTSGNISEEPIAVSNLEARKNLSSLADAFLMHDRDIRTRCDDSVLRVLAKPNEESRSPENSSPVSSYFLRRSRGYAPDSVRLPFSVTPVLAVGPELKNTICVTRNQYAFISQHIGDLENYDTLMSFEDTVSHMETLFRIKPQAIFYDMHPDYLATRYALDRAAREELPSLAIQHHHAHIASCMAENGIDRTRTVIGLSLDGSGYGIDGAIWGGEVLVVDYKKFERKYHLQYFPLPGGDAAIKRPARLALALLWSLGIEWDTSLKCFKDLSATERSILFTQLERKLFTPKTSSIGRLFDAAASLSGVRQRVNYEAQAAIEFESAMDLSEVDMYHFEIQGSVIVPQQAILALVADVGKNVPIPIISARFHNGLSKILRAVCDEIRNETGICDVVLSGGVWQNMRLLEKTTEGLASDGFAIFLHHHVPTNDGGIALGQALVGTQNLGL